MFYYRNKAVVLTYHNISNDFFNNITISPERLKSDLEMIKNCGFNVITLNEIINSINGKQKVPDNAVAITFDDGLKAVYDYAFPLLKYYNIPATCFIITSRCNNYIDPNNGLSYLNKDLIKKMYESNIFDIQSHTHDCHMRFKDRFNIDRSVLKYRLYNKNDKGYESKHDYMQRLRDDFTNTKRIIYDCTGKYPRILCFPFGEYNNQVIKIAEYSGFDYFVSCKYGCNTFNTNEDIIKRLNVGMPYLTSDKIENNIVECANKTKRGIIKRKFRSLRRRINNLHVECR